MNRQGKVNLAHRKLGATRLKLKNRIFSSESTSRNWCGRIKTKQESDERNYSNWFKETCCVITRIETHGIHWPSIHKQDLSVFAKEIVNVSKRHNILNDVENVNDFFEESRHLGPIMYRSRQPTKTQNSRILKACSTLIKSWLWNILKMF